MKRPVFLGLLALKLGFTGFALWFVATRVDLSDALATLFLIDPRYASAAAAIALGQYWLASARFAIVPRLVNKPLSQGEAARITFIGGFFGQAFATFVSGDAMRVWLLARHGAGYRAAAEAVLLDRVFGIAALVVLIALGLPMLLAILPSDIMRAGAALVTAGFAGLIGGFVVLGWLRPFSASDKFSWLADFAGAARHILAAPAKAAGALSFGLAVQLLSVASIYVLFHGLGVTVSALNCFIFIPFVMLLAMLPISFAGWGLREASVVAAFALTGIASEPALSVSIAFGLIILIASLPGLVLWLTGAARMPKGSMAASENSPAALRMPP